MTAIAKTYWKWDQNYDAEQYSLGNKISTKELLDAFELISQTENEYTFQFKNNPNRKIVVKDETIVKKFFFGAGNIEKLTIERDFQLIVENKLQDYLQFCSQNTECKKLVLCYVDQILNCVILTL